MIPSMYQEYLRVIYEALANENFCPFDSTLFQSEEDSDTVALTIKNYNKIGGLSYHVFTSTQALQGITESIPTEQAGADTLSPPPQDSSHENVTFKLKGPMGKGL